MIYISIGAFMLGWICRSWKAGIYIFNDVKIKSVESLNSEEGCK